jgi:hypothetical protein
MAKNAKCVTCHRFGLLSAWSAIPTYVRNFRRLCLPLFTGFLQVVFGAGGSVAAAFEDSRFGGHLTSDLLTGDAFGDRSHYFRMRARSRLRPAIYPSRPSHRHVERNLAGCYPSHVTDHWSQPGPHPSHFPSLRSVIVTLCRMCRWPGRRASVTSEELPPQTHLVQVIACDLICSVDQLVDLVPHRQELPVRLSARRHHSRNGGRHSFPPFLAWRSWPTRSSRILMHGSI